MERAVPSLKWKTTASAACIPRRDSTSPYSMAATVFPTASRIVCSLFSGLGGPIILGCSPLLACWLSIRAPSAPADDLYLPTPRILPLHASTREREESERGGHGRNSLRSSRWSGGYGRPPERCRSLHPHGHPTPTGGRRAR